MIQSQLRNCTFRPRSKLKTTICVVFDLDQMEDIRIAEGCLLFPFFPYISCIPRHCFQAVFVIPIMLELKTDPMYNVCLLNLLYI